MRKLILIAVTFFLFLSLPVHANEISVFLDDERIVMENYPTVENGQMLVPILDISKAMGYPFEVRKNGEWVIRIGKSTIAFRPESNQINIDGKLYTMERAPYMRNTKPFLPLGILQKATGFEIYYDITHNAVFIQGPRMILVPGAIKVYAPQAGYLFFVGANKKIGLADERGNIIVGPEWDEVLPTIREGIVVFRVQNQWGMMHVTKGSLYAPKWDRISHYVHGVAIAYRKGIAYALDLRGETIVGGQSEDIIRVGKGLMYTRVLDDTKQGAEVIFYNDKGYPLQTIKDELGGLLEERIYSDAKPWGDQVAKVINRVTNEMGLVNRFGVEILTCEYKEIGDLGPDGFARIKKKNDEGVLREGIVRSDGIRVAKAEYRKVHLPYSNGLCLVEKYGRLGYIDTKGDVVIDFQFEEAHPFIEGKALVRGFINGKGKKQYFYIDTKGKFVGTPKLGKDGRPVTEKISKNVMAGKVTIFESGEKYGLKGTNGEVIWAPVWDEMISVSSDHFAIRSDEKWALVDRFGRLITPFKYVRIERETGSKDVFKVVEQEEIKDKKTKKVTPEKATWVDYNGRILYETQNAR